MEIGLVSDTHGYVDVLERVVERFRALDLEFLIHTGDVTRFKHMEPLFRLGIPIHLAFGNMDRDPDEYKRIDSEKKLTVHGSAGRLEIRDWVIGFTHGHYDSFLRQFKREGVDYLIRGHTHDRTDRKSNGTRIINPGAVKPPDSSAAVLDLSRDDLSYYSFDS